MPSLLPEPFQLSGPDGDICSQGSLSGLGLGKALRQPLEFQVWVAMRLWRRSVASEGKVAGCVNATFARNRPSVTSKVFSKGYEHRMDSKH